jgi:hypothetical protein
MIKEERGKESNFFFLLVHLIKNPETSRRLTV